MGPSYVDSSVSQYSSTTLSSYSFCLLFSQYSLNLEVGVIDIDVSSRAEHSMVSYSTTLTSCDLCINLYLLKKEACLMKLESCTDL